MTSTQRRIATPPTASSFLQILFLLVFILAFFPSIHFTVLNLLATLSSSVTHLALSNPSSSPTSLPSIVTPQPPTASPPTATMAWLQKTIELPSRPRGSHLITDHIVSELPELRNYKIGLLHLFVQHTSCALSLNENWDSEVREDMSDALDRIVPEDEIGNVYRHSAEGPDDMPAHIKTSLIGSSVTIPISNGRLATGTWQGIWYLEFRTARLTRKVVATIQGEKQ